MLENGNKPLSLLWLVTKMLQISKERVFRAEVDFIGCKLTQESKCIVREEVLFAITTWAEPCSLYLSRLISISLCVLGVAVPFAQPSTSER